MSFIFTITFTICIFEKLTSGRQHFQHVTMNLNISWFFLAYNACHLLLIFNEWFFFMTGKYFTCNLLNLMTYLLKHEHHEWFVMKILEKIKVYFKLKNCGIQNVLKLFWIRLLYFYLWYLIQCFSCLIIYINFVSNNIPRLRPFW